jgi:hypothetical protein
MTVVLIFKGLALHSVVISGIERDKSLLRTIGWQIFLGTPSKSEQTRFREIASIGNGHADRERYRADMGGRSRFWSGRYRCPSSLLQSRRLLPSQ